MSSIAEPRDGSRDDYYRNSYAHFSIHEEMIKDEVRTQSYRRAILENPHLFREKIVLDVGCGTGILSLFAAQAGAKHVYAVDMSDIVIQAKQIVLDNKFSDKITCIQGKIEDVQLPVEKVDIIISEWMGYFLLYESMLDTVLYARDKWLAPGGLIFPDKASLYICAIEDAEYRRDKLDFWHSVYGFNMAPIYKLALLEPLVDCCDPEQVISNAVTVLNVDIYTVKKEDLDFQSEFQLEINRNETCHAVVAFFNVEFSKTHTQLWFSTGPKSKSTHWKQTVFYIENPLAVKTGDVLKGHISVKRNNKNPRDLDIELGVGVGKIPKQPQSYRLR